MRHLDLLQRFPLKDNWMKELDSEVAGGSEDSQQIQPKSKTQLSGVVKPVSEQPSGLAAKAQLKNGETCEWTTIQPELCANVC